MAVLPAPLAQTRLQPARWRAGGVVLGAVLLAHALLLGAWPGSPGAGSRVQPSLVSVRTVAAPTPLAMGLAESGPAAPRKPPAARRDAPAPTPAAPVEAAPEAPTRPVADAAGNQPVPTYRTSLPPGVTLRYALQRGASSGAAELDWRPAGDQYQITLIGRIAAAPALGGSSQGGLDAHGIAPMRYVESRRGRDLRAANFQRDRGVVSFSGPAIEHPLVPGGQDRLSWMMQLAGVMAADPALADTGRQIAVWVAGARGDAEVWTFTVQGLEDLSLPAGAVTGALRLLREPIGPYDTRAEVWLDPARHHLPVQVRLGIRAGGEPLEFRLQDLQAAPGS